MCLLITCLPPHALADVCEYSWWKEYNSWGRSGGVEKGDGKNTGRRDRIWLWSVFIDVWMARCWINRLNIQWNYWNVSKSEIIINVLFFVSWLLCVCVCAFTMDIIWWIPAILSLSQCQFMNTARVIVYSIDSMPIGRIVRRIRRIRKGRKFTLFLMFTVSSRALQILWYIHVLMCWKYR